MERLINLKQFRLPDGDRRLFEEGISMGAVFYELCGADEDRRFSPYCWRALMALHHKGLDVERRALQFTQISNTIGDDVKTVPVLDTGAQKITGSFKIAEYLEETYPDKPSLFKGAGGLVLSRMFEAWADVTILAGTVRLIVSDIHSILGEDSQAYFRTTREKRFGDRLENLAIDREHKIEAVRNALTPLRMTLRNQPFLGGSDPLFVDHIVFGSLQWPRISSSLAVLSADDPLNDWFERCLDLYGGLGRSASPLSAA